MYCNSFRSSGVCIIALQLYPASRDEVNLLSLRDGFMILLTSTVDVY